MLEPSAEVKVQKLTAIKEMHIVQCLGFRCAAYRDPEGKWRDAWRGDVLPEPIKVVHLVD